MTTTTENDDDIYFQTRYDDVDNMTSTDRYLFLERRKEWLKKKREMDKKNLANKTK